MRPGQAEPAGPGEGTGQRHQLDEGAFVGDVAAVMERAPGTDGIGHKLSQLLLGFLATEVVPMANRLAELGIDPTPLFATTTGILRLCTPTPWSVLALDRDGPGQAEPPRPSCWARWTAWLREPTSSLR
jgi:hypothetical protein